MKPLCDAMGTWGMRWLEVEPQHTDPAYVLWTTARLVDTDKLPTRDPAGHDSHRRTRPAAAAILAAAAPPAGRGRQPLPGTPEDLVVHTDADALARWHLRQLTYRDLLRQNRMSIDGPRTLARAFPTWVRPSPYVAQSPIR